MPKSRAEQKEYRSKDFMLPLNNIKRETLKVGMVFSNGICRELNRKANGFSKFKHDN